MKALNAEGAEDFRKLPRLKDYNARELAAEAASMTLLDLRRPEAFGGAHIPDSINIGEGPNLSLWAGWMLDAAVPTVLLNDSASEEAWLALLRVGLDGVAGQLKGGLAAWIEAGLPLARTTQLSTGEVYSGSADSLVLDVRNQNEWDSGHMERATHIDLGDLPERLKDFSPVKPIIAVCRSGYRSNIAASVLQRYGFTRVSSMDGGINAWKAQGLPQHRS